MSPYEASVIPFEDWQPGYANVLPLPPGPTDMPTVIPLDLKPAGVHQVTRAMYPLGLVIVLQGGPPPGPPSIMPLVWEDGDDVDVTIGAGSNNPNGIVVLFRGK